MVSASDGTFLGKVKENEFKGKKRLRSGEGFGALKRKKKSEALTFKNGYTKEEREEYSGG